MQGQKNVGFLKKGPRGCFFSASLKPQTETKKKKTNLHTFFHVRRVTFFLVNVVEH